MEDEEHPLSKKELGSRQLARDLFGEDPASWGRERGGVSARHSLLLLLVVVTAIAGAWEGLYQSPGEESLPPSRQFSSQILPPVQEVLLPIPSRDEPLPDMIPLPPSQQVLEEEVMESRIANPGLSRHEGGGWRGGQTRSPEVKPRGAEQPAKVKARKPTPFSMIKRMEQGYLALHKGQPKEAETAFRQVLEQDPQHADAKRGLDWLSSSNGDYMDFVMGRQTQK